jgi:YegS/Rv2252/BmrU family lipid kinase
MRASLLYNPAAGRMPIRYFIDGAANVLARLGWEVEVAETQSGAHTTELARQAAESDTDVLFAVGGDGTIGQAAAGLIGTQTALGVLPAGTQNVLALELGLNPLDWNRWTALEDNLRILADSSIQAVDIGVCNAQPFIMWAGLGLDAMTIQSLEPRGKWEKYFAVPQYAAQTIWNATFWSGVDLHFWADEQMVAGHFMVAVINNIRSYLGGLAKLSPDAYLDDGAMDLWLFSGDNLLDAFHHAFGMMAGRHLTDPNARRVPFRTLRVEADEPFSLQMDGEPRGACTELTLTVQPQALRLLMPESALHLLKTPRAYEKHP